MIIFLCKFKTVPKVYKVRNVADEMTLEPVHFKPGGFYFGLRTYCYIFGQGRYKLHVF